MAVTTSGHLPAQAEHEQSKLPWYIRDLHKYLLTFAGLTVMYVGLRLYQGAFGVLAGLDSTEPAFQTRKRSPPYTGNGKRANP